jgi:perosamine synthetase
MPLSPQPRFRFYGSPHNGLAILGGALSGSLRRDESSLTRLEQRIAEDTGAKYSLCLPRARVGIYLAVRHLIQPGQKVILSPYTIHEVINMVICAGGRPVFADVDPSTCNISAGAVRDLLDGDTGAVMVTHLHGLACELRELVEICASHDVPLIEDAAQSFGGRFEGRPLGTIGDVGIFSFSLKKNVNALFGGALVTSNKTLYERIAAELGSFRFEDNIKLLRAAGKCLLGDLATAPVVFQTLTCRLLRYDTLRGAPFANKVLTNEGTPVLRSEFPPHYRRRMSPAQARLVLRQLDRVEQDMQLRIDYARMYHRGLADLEGIILSPLREDGSHIYLHFPIQVADRLDLLQYMAREGRDVGEQAYWNTADLPCFSRYARWCPAARLAARRVLLLPTYPKYRKSEVRRNIDAIRNYFRYSTVHASDLTDSHVMDS